MIRLHFLFAKFKKKKFCSKVSKYIVADDYFSKIIFARPFLFASFQGISRLRNDTDLQDFFYREQKKAKYGCKPI